MKWPLLVVLLLGACGPSSEERALMRSIKNLSAQRDALKAELQARQKADGLTKNNASVLAVAMTPADLEAAYQAVMPIRFSASTLSSYVDGTVIVEKVDDARIEGRMVRMTLSGRGQGIKLNVDPGPYKREARELIEGLHAGLTLRVRGELSLEDGPTPRVLFHGYCEGAELKKNAKKDYLGTIRQGVNERLLDEPFPIEVPRMRIGNRDWRIQGILPTQGRIIALFAP